MLMVENPLQIVCRKSSNYAKPMMVKVDGQILGSWVSYHEVQMDRLKDLSTRCKNSELKCSHDFLLVKNRYKEIHTEGLS